VAKKPKIVRLPKLSGRDRHIKVIREALAEARSRQTKP
jgi:hypothetical protein